MSQSFGEWAGSEGGILNPEGRRREWALATLILAGPILAYPEILPANYRAEVVTALVVFACALTGLLAPSWRQPLWGLWVFLLALLAGWASMREHDSVAIRHFGGLGLGCLLMTVAATWSRTPPRLVQVATLFSLAALVIVAVGLAGTQVFPSKFVAGVELVPETLYFWMPRLRLGLPGLSDNGYVNPNALGGTALMILPTCAALAAWAWSTRRRLLVVIPAGATLMAAAALTVTLSRTALFATMLTALVLGLWLRRTRRWVLTGVALAVVLVLVQAVRVTAFGSSAPDSNWQDVLRSLVSRSSIWGSALAALSADPLLGTGINQFHQVAPSIENTGITYVAHAHNVFLQVALDVGVLGFAGYMWLMAALLVQASKTARGTGAPAWIAGGAGLSLIGLHLFGLADAIALGAKVGAFQWLSSGLILGAAALDQRNDARDLRSGGRVH